MKEVPNAREYYYSVIAPEEEGKNYSEVYHQNPIENFEYLQEYEEMNKGSGHKIDPNSIYDHIPFLSNCPLLESLFKEMLSSVDSTLENRLAKMFIAKRHDLKFNAGALPGDKEYLGEIIFFMVGLSDACYQYSQLFAEILTLKVLRSGKEKNSEVIQQQIYYVADQAITLANAQKYWITDGNHIIIKLREELFLKSSSFEAAQIAGGVSTFTDLFILGHEIAHHLLGHLGNMNIGDIYLEKLPEDCKFWLEASKKHSKEFKADALALLLISGITKSNVDQQSKNTLIIHSVLGALLTLTVSGQVIGDLTASTITHPSIENRFKQCRRIFENYLILNLSDEYATDAEYVLDDILGFQSMLYQTQNIGFKDSVKDAELRL